MPTVNPPLVKDLITELLFPQPFVQETFLMRRDGVSFESSSTVYGKLSGSGSIHLSNTRLVFHCTKTGKPKEFVSYELLLSEIAEPNFKQPIFGANYLEGLSNLTGDKWKLTFYHGGCGTFLRVLNELLTALATMTRTVDSPVVLSYSPASVNVGYVDPTDPSIVYVQQPVAASAPPPPAE
jgi:hypothetical protein